MSTEFKIGDCVRLKSGGPVMTIRQQEQADFFYCEWFTKDEKHDGRIFHKDQLEIVNDDDGVPPLPMRG